MKIKHVCFTEPPFPQAPGQVLEDLTCKMSQRQLKLSFMSLTGEKSISLTWTGIRDVSSSMRQHLGIKL